jgi:hypothetical protein
MTSIVPTSPASVARVNMTIQNNQTWQDAFQLGTPGDTSWSFVNQNFRVDLKADPLSPQPLLTCTSVNGYIVVDDPINRVLNFNVPESVFAAANMVPGLYHYDLIMYDNSSPPIRVPLMRGKLRIQLGISGG